MYKVGQELSEEGVLRNTNTEIIHVVLVHFYALTSSFKYTTH